MGHVIPLNRTEVHIDVAPAIEQFTKAMVELRIERAHLIDDAAVRRGPGLTVVTLQVTLADHFAQALAAHPGSYIHVDRLPLGPVQP